MITQVAVLLAVSAIAAAQSQKTESLDTELLDAYEAVFEHPLFSIVSAPVYTHSGGPFFVVDELDVVDGRLALPRVEHASIREALVARDQVRERQFMTDALMALAQQDRLGPVYPAIGKGGEDVDEHMLALIWQFRLSYQWLKADAAVSLYEQNEERAVECAAAIFGLIDHLAEQRNPVASQTAAMMLANMLRDPPESALQKRFWALEGSNALRLVAAIDRLDADDPTGARQAWMTRNRAALDLWRGVLLAPGGSDRYLEERALRARSEDQILNPVNATELQDEAKVAEIAKQADVSRENDPYGLVQRVLDGRVTCATQQEVAEVDDARLIRAFAVLDRAIDDLDAAWRAGDRAGVQRAYEQLRDEPMQLGRMALDLFGLVGVSDDVDWRERLAELRRHLVVAGGEKPP